MARVWFVYSSWCLHACTTWCPAPPPPTTRRNGVTHHAAVTSVSGCRFALHGLWINQRFRAVVACFPIFMSYLIYDW
uniref:Secreted protein n=1 Tax=Knipowitschia caucasica TaxID=637954 RepID=A0AAV2MT08_KNICA